MTSTFHTDHYAGGHTGGRRFSGFSTSLISAGMLALGLVLGSSGWLEERRGTTAGLDDTSRSIAVPSGALIRNDWRGNSAGISGKHRSETR